MPVLGFIGTVLGLSEAIGGFGGALASGNDLSQLKHELQGVTGGLAVAFETTLIALVAALGLQLLNTGLRKNEEAFLDACNDFTYLNVTSRLRLMDLTESVEETV